MRPSLTDEDIKRGTEKRELDGLRLGCIQEKDFTVIEMWECEWWQLYKKTTTDKLHIRKNFPYRRSLTQQQLLERKKKGKVLSCVQGGVEVPEKERANFDYFPPLFKNTLVSKNDIPDLIKRYAEEEKIMSQPPKMLISSFTLHNGNPITALLLFYLQLGLFVTKKQRFVQYIPKKIFSSFVQSAVDAR